MKQLAWATLFGIEGQEETEVAWDKAVDWALESNIGIAFKEINARNRKEYEIDEAVVTLRFFDYESGSPRVEKKGLREILDFVVAP